MEAWEIASRATLNSEAGLYSREILLDDLQSMTTEQVNDFCKEILHLRHFYDSNVGASVTDVKELIADNPGKFWKLKEIDFKQPIYFERIK